MSDACAEPRILIVDDGAPVTWAPAVAALLEPAAGGRFTVCGTCPAAGPLVQTVVREAPQVLLWLLGAPDPALPARLDALAQAAALPVLLWPVSGLAPPPDDWVAELVARETALWWPAPAATDAAAVAATLPLQLRWQMQRHALARARQEALDDARQRLDERKWVDRAKGMLMQHQQLSESDAFALLRTASQHANLRVGEISRGLLEAAQAAEAINRGGQLRMLSQRLVKGCALQSGMAPARPRAAPMAAAGAGSGAGAAVRNWDAPLIDDSVQRLQANLVHLASLSTMAAVPEVVVELQRSQEAWQAVQLALEPAMVGGSAAELLALDARAEALLEAAEGLTAALERASGRRSLRLVNLCGRQRMLSQRLAKQALLASRCEGEAAALQAAAAVRTLGELEHGLRTLEAAPLSTEDIRSALARALGQWQRLRQTLAAPVGAGSGADATALLLARESEALLASFEHLTSLYEHSMQVLLG
ncbi:MAG: hypothetical protein RLY78_624 [Pseudomonadota bacterium]